MPNLISVDVVLYTVPLQVTGYYTPEVPQVMYYSDGSGYPGDPEEFEITDVFANDLSVMEIIHEDYLETIEKLVLYEISDNYRSDN